MDDPHATLPYPVPTLSRPGLRSERIDRSEVPANGADKNIVGSMRADRDAEPSEDEDPGEIDARQPSGR